MTKPDYTELDAAILEAVSRPGRHTLLSVEQDISGRVFTPLMNRRTTPAQYVEKRMQALRRAWKVEYHHANGWQRRQP